MAYVFDDNRVRIGVTYRIADAQTDKTSSRTLNGLNFPNMDEYRTAGSSFANTICDSLISDMYNASLNYQVASISDVKLTIPLVVG